jgi:hypothetical protein
MPLGLDNIDTSDYGMLHFFMPGQPVLSLVNCSMFFFITGTCLSLLFYLHVSVFTMLSPEIHLLYIKDCVNELLW